MKIILTYEIGDKIVRQGLAMDPKQFASLHDPYSHVGRTLANLVAETAPAAAAAVDEVIIKDAMEALARRLGLA